MAEVDLSNRVGKIFRLKREDGFVATIEIKKGGFIDLLEGSHIRKAEAPGMKNYRKAHQKLRQDLKDKGKIGEGEPFDFATKTIEFGAVAQLAGVVGGSSRSGDTWKADDGDTLTN